jgi:hypothetical protein
MGAAAAAILAAKERETIEAFTRAGATTPARAQSLHAIGITEGPAVRRLRDRAVVREAVSGMYYVDLERWRAVRRTRLRIVLGLAIVAFAIGIALWFLSSGPPR